MKSHLGILHLWLEIVIQCISFVNHGGGSMKELKFSVFVGGIVCQTIIFSSGMGKTGKMKFHISCCSL